MLRQMVRLLTRLVGAALTGLLVASAAAAPTRVQVSVSPRSALLDAPLHIRVTGLPEREMVSLRVTEPAYPRGVLFASRRVRANGHGVLDLPRPDLLGTLIAANGTPKDASPLFTSTIRVVATTHGRAFPPAYASRFVNAASVAIKNERPAETGFYGAYFRPAATSSHTAILLIGGSNGGLPNAYAAGLLASHGFPLLSLAYFSEPGLPSELERIPLEYFQKAIEWLAAQPEVDPRKIVVVGVSRGGEVALLIGSIYSRLVRAVAAYVPSQNVNPSPFKATVPAWTLGGVPVSDGPIAVEKIAGPVFVVGAVGDRLWPSSSAVLAIEQRLRANGRADMTVLDYVHAGHGVGAIVPNLTTHPIQDSRYGKLDLGGRPRADEAAREDSWPKLLRFLASV